MWCGFFISMKGKKSFILYCDSIHTFNELTDEEAGKLIKHIFAYTNDQDPQTDDKLIKIAFEPIKQQLKRDLKDWESEKSQRSNAGKIGMEKRWSEHNKAKQSITDDNTVINTITPITNITDSVSVSVSVNDSVTLGERKTKVFTPPTILEVGMYFAENGYSTQSAEKAFNYYDVANWVDSKGNKIKNWKQKMQGVWFKPENKQPETKKPYDPNVEPTQPIFHGR